MNVTRLYLYESLSAVGHSTDSVEMNI